MNITIDHSEIISLETFELGWRFDKIHNSEITPEEKKLILALSSTESKRVNKIIDYYENPTNRAEKYTETNWFSAHSETMEKEERFRKKIENYLMPYTNNLIISWNRKTVLQTSKSIFQKYLTDFLYPGSDDVTIVSVDLNWILFYHHTEVANFWTKNQ